MRVVSLTCSNTEIVCALGCAEMLVGVDRHSDYPENVVNKLPRVGPDLQIDIEKVAALRPDLVLASITVPGHEQVVGGLQKAKLPYFAPETTFIDDIYEDIRWIAQALNVSERGERLIQRMQEQLPEIPTTAPKEGPSILVQWWPKPVIAPGRKSWIHELLWAAGAQHPLQCEDVKSRPIEDEEVRTMAPDAFVLSWCGVPFEKYRPDVLTRNTSWQALDAIRNQHIFCIAEAFMGRPGPRLIQGWQQLKRAVQSVQNSLYEKTRGAL